MSPSRPEPPSLGATRNSTSPLPCPEAGENPEIHPTPLDAVHAHSGCVEIENLPEPPAASIIDGPAKATWHLTGSGPVGLAVVVEDALHAAVVAAIRPTTAENNARRYARTRFDAEVGFISNF